MNEMEEDWIEGVGREGEWEEGPGGEEGGECKKIQKKEKMKVIPELCS